jgi:hypothetical protein
MASFFGNLGNAVLQAGKSELAQSPIYKTIQALRQRRQAPRDPAGAQQVGVFAPGVFGMPQQGPTNGTGMTGPFGPVY